MTFDTIVIGGGLAGLIAGIRLAEEGKKVALLSAGHGSLLFSSGSFGLLGFDESHQVVRHPIDAITKLPALHPYRNLSAESIAVLTEEAAALLLRAGVKTKGSAQENHFRISPLGMLRPTWLSLAKMATLEDLKNTGSRHVAIAGIAGFLDFYPRFIAAALAKEGFRCDILSIDNTDLRTLRNSESEMRSANIARIMHGDALLRFADSVGNATVDSSAPTLILPAVIDDDDSGLNQIVGRKLLYAPTMGMSVPGISIHTSLIRHFVNSGGRLFNGHRATRAIFKGDTLSAIYTDKLDDDALLADNFIFAGGSFFGRGLVATSCDVIEPVLGLDTAAPADRSKWFEADLFGGQPVMDAGLAVDSSFRAMRSGVAIQNLYAVGACLAHADSMRNDSGAGVALLSALAVANKILRD